MSSKCGRISFVPVELSDIFPCLAFPRDAAVLRPYPRYGLSTFGHASQGVNPSVSRGSDSNSVLLAQRELVDVDVALAEHVRASGQILHVAVVDLFGLDGDGLVPSLIQRLRPGFQRPGIVQLQ